MNINRGSADLKIGVISLGCAKNLVNTEQMMFLLSQAGYEVTGEIDSGNIDIVLLNTCGFIESAKSEAIETIIGLGEMKLAGKFSKLIIAGCLSERYKNEILNEMPELDAVVGTGAFDRIVQVVELMFKSDLSSLNEEVILSQESLNDKDEDLNKSSASEETAKIAVYGDIHATISESKRIISTSPVWAYLKIAEGCDNNCAYCVIPSIRGKFRSRPMENIVKEAQELAATGIKELIIVAQDVTMYGLDLYNKSMLAELLEKLCAIHEVRWIRLHYLYPDDITEILIDFISSHDKILKYLDIPIQHINDKVLAKMNRRGTSEDIYKLFTQLREQIPGIVLRTSIITGLPGEGDKEFSELYEFLRKMKIERAGIFEYSPEEGSKAAEMEYPVKEVALKRARILADLQSGIMDEYNLSRVGNVETVLIEGCDVDGNFYGRSFAESPDIDGYITVVGKDIPVHDFVEVRITDVSDGVIVGVGI